MKAPKSAPFFLQTELDETGPRFVPTQSAIEETTNVLKMNHLQPTTELGYLLRQAEESTTQSCKDNSINQIEINAFMIK